MSGENRGGTTKFGIGLARDEKVVEFPDGRAARRQREFCDAVARLKMALAAEKALPVPTRQALVAELGAFDEWAGESRGALPPANRKEVARRILLLDFRLSALRPVAAEVDNSLRQALRQYAEASRSLLEQGARRGPDGEWMDLPRRTEMEVLQRDLHAHEKGDG